MADCEGRSLPLAHKFDPSRMDRLLETERLTWNDPGQVLRPLRLESCTALADVGCGPGWFALEAARRMPPGGKVYGIDLSPEMLERLQARAREAGLTNVEAVLAEEEAEYPVPTESMDAVLIANVYHEVDPASLFLGEVRRMLKRGGVCLVVDWRPEPTPNGPPAAHRVSPQDVRAEFLAAGFTEGESHDVGPYHYGLTFHKS